VKSRGAWNPGLPLSRENGRCLAIERAANPVTPGLTRGDAASGAVEEEGGPRLEGQGDA
jgi:hypothetical protein